MEQREHPQPRTVTLEDDGVIKLTDSEIRRLGGIQPGDKFEFEVIDDESFTFKKGPAPAVGHPPLRTLRKRAGNAGLRSGP